MKMHLIALALVGTAGTADAAPLSAWNGRYVWEESIGRIGGSNPRESIAAFVTRTLTIGPRTGATGCMLSSEGYQTFEKLQCTATPQGRSLVIKFYRMGPDSRPAGYARGQALFTLTMGPRGITTQLQALHPTANSTPRRGRLFRRG